MDLAVPQLRLDLPSRLHPHEDRAQQHTQAWVQEMGMIANSPKAREVCDSFLLGRLAARVYPHASVGRLYVLADWMSAYFILEDVLDDTVEARDPEVATEIADQFIAPFLGTAPQTGPHRVGDVLAVPRIREGLADLWARTRPGMTAAWTNRLVHDMTDYLYSHVRQSEINSSEPPFDEDAYCAHRLLTSAMYVSADLIEVATARPVPEHLIRNPDVATMREAASHVVAWVNDLYSAPKEIRLNDLCNYVVVLTSKLDVSLQEAADLGCPAGRRPGRTVPRRREPRRGRPLPPPAARRPPSPHQNGRRTQDLDDRQRPLGRGNRPLHRPRDPATGPVQHLATLI
ncbi:terpene synthase family protein [Streptomyces sp. NBC_01237]|uniref:terpene synthase family protein n=1 Tax=Streptomyces sp. NBC_01237 TaxID=2903790 RepID=UPI002DD9EA76|nr:hypothetical protein [Streptomyces sp. NBC_01237]WRZ70186.1 hypothetical protein OG251_00180 [Streptomyces sp. NBC_01237]